MIHSLFKITFCVSCTAVVYAYVLYPILLFTCSAFVQAARDIAFLICREGRRRQVQLDFLPRVALLVSAFNEEGIIEEKISNTLGLSYPSDRLGLILGLDGPTDSTAEKAMRIDSPS